MEYSEYQLKTKDGLELFACEWKPDCDIRGIICLVHGLGEHCGRYGGLASYLNHKKFAVTGFDLRGHGRSPGVRGHIGSYSAVLEDISLLESEVSKRYPGEPRFLYGHSLGGNPVLNYALRCPTGFSGIIATSPWLQLSFAPAVLKVCMGFLMSGVWPSFSQSNNLDTLALSHDAEIVKNYIGDPLNHGFISARTFASMHRAGLWALKHAEEFTLPLLLMHGSDDRITSPEASRRFAGLVPENCTLKIWEGLYHELHNEPQKQEVFDFIAGWLESF